jgi:hypothetical protein
VRSPQKRFNKANRYTVQIDRDRHTEVGKLSALNHSCDPNVILDTEHLLMIACRDIEKGEELSFFYPATEWEMAAPFICLCGAANCIHVVAGARFLPLSILENHYLSKHIRELVVEALNNTEQHLTNLRNKLSGVEKSEQKNLLPSTNARRFFTAKLFTD